MGTKYTNPDNPIWSFCTRICDLFLISVLVTVCSIPIFTIGASFTAGYRDMAKITEDAQSSTVKGFFSAFKENFKKATLLWLILLAAIVVVAGDIYFFTTLTQSGAVFALRCLFYLLAILLLFLFLWTFPLTATFENTLTGTLKNALLMSIHHLPWSVLLILILVAPWLLLLVVPLSFLTIIIVFMVLFGFGIQLLLSAYIFRRVFRHYIPGAEDEPKKPRRWKLF